MEDFLRCKENNKTGNLLSLGVWKCQTCPTGSISFHSGQTNFFYLLVLGQYNNKVS